MKILTINPGSTSTKIALFDDLNLLFTKTLRHSSEELSQFSNIYQQYEFRKKIIIDAMKEENCDFGCLDAVVGRGGLLKPISGGVYAVNDAMLVDLQQSPIGEHASNLGGILAYTIAKECGKNVPSYIVDPVVVDELDDIARYSGHPEMPRISIFHALNQKAVARRFARSINKKYEELRLIIVHLGGGITVGAHKYGKVIDVNNGLDGDGPFSPERAGSLPSGQLAKLCFSGRYQLHQVRKMITGNGGLVAYLNTNNATEIEDKILNGDTQAQNVYMGMAYQIAKEVGAISTVLQGKVDCIILTGGLAYSKLLIQWISKRIGFIAPIEVYPGEDEMQALAEGVFYATQGEIPIKEYI